jgi:flagellar hook-associated protein 3 FlgL
MAIRPTQQAIFSQIQRGLTFNFGALVRSQEQVASGKRINRPSDDPVGASQALAFRRQIAAAERSKTVVDGARVMLDTASSSLQDAGGLVAEARSILLQAMNGTQSPDDRKLLGNSIALIRDRLLEIGNQRTGNRFLFGGTATNFMPFVESDVAGTPRVNYAGSDESQEVLVGLESLLTVTLPGDEIFALKQRTGTQFSSLTGVRSGTSADQGTGYVELVVRHDATTASGLTGGVTLGSSAADTIVGDHTLIVDGVANTVQLDNGAAMPIPSSNLGNVVVVNEHGAEVHLDLSAYSGASFSATLSASASVSLDGVNFTAVTLTETDLQLVDAASATVLHIDTRQLHRAGTELVTFGGTVNVFDVLGGIAADLENAGALAPGDLLERLDMWLIELDRNHENVQIATGELGSLSQRATGLGEAFDDEMTQVRGLLSNVEDVDFTNAVLEMTRAEQTLQLAQATSMRLTQNTLLNFLR